MKPIATSPIKSSAFSHEGYDASTETLAITFHSGKTHHYSGVTPAAYAQFKAAPSVGAHFAKHLRPLPNKPFVPEKT